MNVIDLLEMPVIFHLYVAAQDYIPEHSSKCGSTVLAQERGMQYLIILYVGEKLQVWLKIIC